MSIFINSDLQGFNFNGGWTVKMTTFRDILILAETLIVCGTVTLFWKLVGVRGPSPIPSGNYTLACQWSCWQPRSRCFHFSSCDWQWDRFVSHSIMKPTLMTRSYHSVWKLPFPPIVVGRRQIRRRVKIKALITDNISLFWSYLCAGTCSFIDMCFRITHFPPLTSLFPHIRDNCAHTTAALNINNGSANPRRNSSRPALHTLEQPTSCQPHQPPRSVIVIQLTLRSAV